MIACFSAEGRSLGGERGCGFRSEDAGLSGCATGSVPPSRFD